jgi:NADPH-dependent F420 reductase
VPETRIALIGGTGREGAGLALRLSRAGFGVVIGSREAGRAEEAVRRLKPQAGVGRLEAAGNGAAIAGCDVSLLCVSFAHAADTVVAHRDAFRPGSLLIDVTVPVVFDAGRPRFVELPQGSSSEHLRTLLPGHVALAGAFKTLPAHLLADVEAPLDCDDFVCGDSAESRARAMEIVGRIPGLRPIDAGSLDAARVLERMTVLAIRLNRRYKVHDARFRVLGV